MSEAQIKATQPQGLIRVENLEKKFKNPKNTVLAVDQVNLDIYQGETLGLVGESGCGKSTLGRMIVGLETPTAGKVFYQNQPFFEMKKKAKKEIRTEIQMIFQDPYSALNPRKTVGNILRTPLLYHRIVPKNQVDKQIYTLMDQVGLSKKSIDRYPHEFSGGQRQRICIAQALSLNPRVIICDEPVSALDVSIQAQILNLLKDIQKEKQLTYLFIAHGLGAISYVSDRVAVMYLGEIIELAPTKELFTYTLHPYTQALCNAAPVPNPHLRDEGGQAPILQGEARNEKERTGCKFYDRCPFRMKKCKTLRPVLQKAHTPAGTEHWVACHYVMDKQQGGAAIV